MQINPTRREVYFKIVYYGPGLSGKTTNLEVIHRKAPASQKGELTSIATEGERTLFFDYMPLDLGAVNGLKAKLQLYTVPGQTYYDATRKLVLQGVDGVVFVADSQAEKMAENVASLENLAEHLARQGYSIEEIPLVLQWNKRDLPNALPVEDLERKLNRWNAHTFEACAVNGDGVFPTLKKLAQIVLEKLAREQDVRVTRPRLAPVPRPVPVPPPPRPSPASGERGPSVHDFEYFSRSSSMSSFIRSERYRRSWPGRTHSKR